MKKPTLVIIDMQGGFPSALNEATIQNVLREIERAKRDESPILIVELRPNHFGSTLPQIRDAVNDCSHAEYCEKIRNDGSYEIVKECERWGFNCKKFRVCGVNASACVQETVESLVYEYDATVEVVKDACNGMPHTSDLTWVEKAKDKKLCLV